MPHPPTDLPLAATALFLDFDGTLAGFVEDPMAVTVAPEVCARLSDLQTRLDGALAIVTGRSIEAIDRFLDGRVRTVAGVHGHLVRHPDGVLREASIDKAAFNQVLEALQLFALPREGVMVEVKPNAVALHYRRAPHEADHARDAVEAAVAPHPAFHVQPGKFVFEVIGDAENKGSAIAALMKLPAFTGRRPVFVGDDATDEAGFVTVNELDGLDRKSVV